MRNALLFCFSVLAFGSFAFAAEIPPSRTSCEYYRTLENQLQCGHDAYFSKWGYPLCQMYLSREPVMSTAIQVWFREVRYCLQEDLRRSVSRSELQCQGLDEKAIESHVDCYAKTRFCDLSYRDQLAVFNLTAEYLSEPMWLETSAQIFSKCYL